MVLAGIAPTTDCPDANIYYGFGTYAASLCCGLQLGVAKNATIHSGVRPGATTQSAALEQPLSILLGDVWALNKGMPGVQCTALQHTRLRMPVAD